MVNKTNPTGNTGLSANLLPNFYQTPANKKFLQATLDQLYQPGTATKTSGYIGRKSSKTSTGKDIFVEAADSVRQNYQLEPGMTVKDSLGNTTFFKDYVDYINQVKVFGGNVDNHARLNAQEFYSWDPHIDWDKFVNFQNYYWLPYGPDTIKLYGQSTGITSTYTVDLQTVGSSNEYVFTPNGLEFNPILKLYRGQTYTFVINSPGNPFSLKTLRGDGTANRYIIPGIDNYGVEKGTITMTIPAGSPDVLYYQSETDINLGGMIEVYDITDATFLNVESDILGKKTYTLANGTPLSNGMKLEFGGNTLPQSYTVGQYYVEGVGTAIRLVPADILEIISSYTVTESIQFDASPFDQQPFDNATGYAKAVDYITINRASRDHNPWSRYNRWFHKDVVNATATYNGTVPVLDQLTRATRPIIEFQADLKLFNLGTTAISDIDLIDDYTTDAFSIIEGSNGYNVDGVAISQDQRILFTADTDPLVMNKVFKVDFITVNGNRQIHLIEDTLPIVDAVALIKSGTKNQGQMYWFNGYTWAKGQQKTSTNQPPLFDVVDDAGYSYGDSGVYNGSTFKGTSVFTYKVNTGVNDPVLGFPLSYQNVSNIGDIVFEFTLANDTFAYKESLAVVSKAINVGYLMTQTYAGNSVYVNGWKTCISDTVQAAVRIYDNSGLNNNFPIDIFDDISQLADLQVKVYVNGVRFDKTRLVTNSDGTTELMTVWNITDGPVYKVLSIVPRFATLAMTDIVTIKAYAAQPINTNGYYEIPVNLQNNPMNDVLTSFTLGEVSDHVNSIIDNITGFVGSFPGASNLRDLGSITEYGTKFVQHSGPLSLSLYHITSETNNIVHAIEQSRDDYSNFKRVFIAMASTLGVDASPEVMVDSILQKINANKPKSTPYYFSDMVPYGAKIITDLKVVDSRVKSYPLSAVFTLDKLSNKAVGVYLNGTQLVHGRDYAFNAQGFVEISTAINVNDVISTYEYDNTDGSFVPATPSKLGIWPKYEPAIYMDTALVTPRLMIQCHDGSQLLAYGDYRDDLILELEKRIYNNIKVQYDPSIFDINDTIPGYSRTTDYSLQEYNDVLAPNFYKWTNLVGVDFTKPLSYDRSNPFTYNYANNLAFDGSAVPAYWRGIYRWLLDTDRPNICPWEMLGFTIQPTWWTTVYGPAPYTSDNLVMWQDISNGMVNEPGKPAVKLSKYVRPYLMAHLPVNSDGDLISPLTSGLVSGTISQNVDSTFVFGDVGPVEAAWRRSSHYPFSALVASMLLTPAKTFGLALDRSRIMRNLAGQLVYSETMLRIRPTDIVLPSIYTSSARVQTSGIVNYIVEYVLNHVFSNNVNFYNSYQNDLDIMVPQLSYRVGAFTNKDQFKLILESKTPSSSGNVFIPAEDYSLFVNKSSPVKKLTYSGIIVTKLSAGFEIKGYSNSTPYFNYFAPSQTGATINIGGISSSFTNWTANQQYIAGSIVRYGSAFYAVKSTHTSATTFDASLYSHLAALPMNGGVTVSLRSDWARDEALVLPYGTVLTTPQAVTDFIIGHGEWMKSQGFVFDTFNTTNQTVSNWETSAREFLFWTTQNWSTGEDKWSDWTPNQPVSYGSIVRFNGDYYSAIFNIQPESIFDVEKYNKLDGLSNIGSSVISLSPSANGITFETNLTVVDSVSDAFNNYEIFKVDGTPIPQAQINSYRDGNTVTYSSNVDGIYNASFYLIQHEHVVTINNSTIFNDVIYSPTSGYRQERMKLSAYVTTNWYGGLDIPGFIFDQANIQNWQPWQDYHMGDIVNFQGFYYSANEFIAGSATFDANKWVILQTKPEAKILPNWTNIATQFTDFYSLDVDGFDTAQQTMAQHLIGYQKRQYLENIIQDDVSEFKFYQGMIREKGTQNVLNKIFDALSSDGEESLVFFEEWALRVGQYGASGAFENIEFVLDESKFKVNPQGIVLTNRADPAFNPFTIQQTPNDVYLKPLGYNSAPFQVVGQYNPYLRSAGYVNPADVFLTIPTISDILTQDIETFNDGAYVWCTFEGTSWMVYRYTDIGIHVTNVTYSNGVMTISTDALVQLEVGQYVGISQVPSISGFYQVTSVNLKSFTVAATIANFPSAFTQIYEVVVYALIKQRTSSIDNIDTIMPARLTGNEILWTDDSGSGSWATWKHKPVYTKKLISNTTPEDGLTLGMDIAMNAKSTISAMNTSTGSVIIHDKVGVAVNWVQRQIITKPFFAQLHYGDDVNASITASTVMALDLDGTWLAVGSPLIGQIATRLKTTGGPYVIGDIVRVGNAHYSAIVNTSQAPGPSASDWKLAPYIPVSTSATNSTGTLQGVVSIYKKDFNNNYTLVDTLASPLLRTDANADQEMFGSSLAFGNNVLYVGAAGYANGTGKVYTLKYSRTDHTTTRYNPVGSSFGTLAVLDTSNIRVGMHVSGTGFTSGQKVIEIVNSRVLKLDGSPNSTPDGILTFYTTSWNYVWDNHQGEDTGSNFGNNIVVSSDFNTVLISASDGVHPGIVSIYNATDSGLSLLQSITSSTGSTRFGQSVAVSNTGEFVAISDDASGAAHSGSVGIYSLVNGQYSWYQDLVGHNIEANARFGNKIAFMHNYDTIVVYSQDGDTLQPMTFDSYSKLLYTVDTAPTYKSSEFIQGVQYQIKELGTTDWNYVADTIGIVYAVGDILTAVATNGIGSGTAIRPEDLYINDTSSDVLTPTTFDKHSTAYVTRYVDGGRIDIYDRYSTKWVYSESLDNTSSLGDGYGTGFATGADHILVSTPYVNDAGKIRSGKIYDYGKPVNALTWSITSSVNDIPDVSKVKKAFLYNKTAGELVTYLDVLDPAQGKIPGVADQEIRYKTYYDPAIYSTGTSDVNVRDGGFWSTTQVGTLWWDLRTAKFVDTYVSDSVYKNNNWNTLSVGASIDIYEWVESNLKPAAWDAIADTPAGLAVGVSGVSLYGNSVYSERIRYDNVSKVQKSTFYFWVKNKNITPAIEGRSKPALEVANLIGNPRGQGYTYLAITGVSSFSLVNAKQYLTDSDIVLSIEYWLIDKTDQNIHSQWKLISDNTSVDLPHTVEQKWFDSLCGVDSAGRSVPDLNQPVKLRYGIENRPRQSMFVNRIEALKQFIEGANAVLAVNQITDNYNIIALDAYDPAPSTITGLYDATSDTDAELIYANVGSFKRPSLSPIIEDGKIIGITITHPGRGYVYAPPIQIVGLGQGAEVIATIDTLGQITGATIVNAGEGYLDSTVCVVRDYSVLVASDSIAVGSWSIHSYDPVGKVWSRVLTQAYDVRQFWDYIDWYATGYNQFSSPDYAVSTFAELSTVNVLTGDLVRVLTANAGGWLLLYKYADSTSIDWTQSYSVVGIQNGTIQFKSSLYKFDGTAVGYDASTFDGSFYDVVAAKELRIILNAIRNDILVGTLKQSYINLFLAAIRYAHSEQVYLDWAFKTSFIRATHKVGPLNQPVTYPVDNLADFEAYVAEVKPYRTKVREYISNFTNTDVGQSAVTDFDLQPLYENNKIVPINTWVANGTIQADNAAIFTYPWKFWFDYVGFSVTELAIIDGGSGYLSEPTVEITCESGSGAVARAFISSGKVNRLVLLTPGSKYLRAPTVTITGGSGTGARAVAIIGDSVVRSSLISMKFDRLTYTYTIADLQQHETLIGGTSKVQFTLKWAPDVKIGKSTVTINGIPVMRDEYKLSITKSTALGYTNYGGSIIFDTAPAFGSTISVSYVRDISLLNAADRIHHYYAPTTGQLGTDLSQLMTGIDYGGVQVNGLGFTSNAGWDELPYATAGWDVYDKTFTDYIVQVAADTHTFTMPTVPAAGVQINIYQISKYELLYPNADGAQVFYTYDATVNHPKVYAVTTPVLAAPSLEGSLTLQVDSSVGIAVGDMVTSASSVSGHVTATASNTNLVTLSSVDGLSINDKIKITGTTFGGLASKIYYVKTIVGSAVTLSVNLNGSTVEVSTASGNMVFDRISEVNIGTTVAHIDGNTITLDQIIFANLASGTTITFTRDLVQPIDVIVNPNGTLLLTSPLLVGAGLLIVGTSDPVRLADPAVCDGLTSTFTIDSNIVVNAGDTFILRESTSDGSIAPPESDYDTAISGGPADYDTVVGYNPEALSEIIIDGDGFVTPTSSPAPEEVVPGQVVDAVAIKVYDRPSSGAAKIKVDSFIGDGMTKVFPMSQQPNSSGAVIVKVESNILTNVDDYSVNYRDNTVEFGLATPAPAQGDIVTIFTVGFNGANILDLDHYIGNGVTTEFLTKAPWSLYPAITPLVYLDGVATDVELFQTDSSYEIAFSVGIKFAVAPAVGTVINFIIVDGVQQTFAITKTEQVPTGSDIVAGVEYPLTNTIGNSLPNESNMIVRVDQTILDAPRNSYFKIGSNRLTYTLDSTAFPPHSVDINSIKVYVDGIALKQGIEYVVDLGVISVKITKPVYELYKGQRLVVSVLADHGYAYTGNSIAFTDSYSGVNVVEVISSYVHDVLDIERTTVTVASTQSLASDSVEFYYYNAVASGIFELSSSVIDESYVWVTKNNVLLSPGVDYKLNDDHSSVSLVSNVTIGDKVSLMTFGNNVTTSSIAYMQFKDMLNRVHFKRLSLNKQARLVNDLRFDDVEFEVDDGSNFANPNAAYPGIVEINGERIEYFTKNGNVFSTLRRATLGTGAPAIHRAGTHVQDIGATETIPYADNTATTQYLSSGLSVIDLDYAPMQTTIADGHVYTSVQDWIDAGFTTAFDPSLIQADDIEVFVGGTRLRNRPYYVYDAVNGPTSPDLPYDADYAVDGVSNTVVLRVAVPVGVRITVVKRSGTDWDSSINTLSGSGKIADFIKATPGIWYHNIGPIPAPVHPSFDSTSITFDNSIIRFNQGI